MLRVSMSLYNVYQRVFPYLFRLPQSSKYEGHWHMFHIIQFLLTLDVKTFECVQKGLSSIPKISVILPDSFRKDQTSSL